MLFQMRRGGDSDRGRGKWNQRTHLYKTCGETQRVIYTVKITQTSTLGIVSNLNNEHAQAMNKCILSTTEIFIMTDIDGMAYVKIVNHYTYFPVVTLFKQNNFIPFA
jgi:hypothetical protein